MDYLDKHCATHDWRATLRQLKGEVAPMDSVAFDRHWSFVGIFMSSLGDGSTVRRIVALTKGTQPSKYFLRYFRTNYTFKWAIALWAAWSREDGEEHLSAQVYDLAERFCREMYAATNSGTSFTSKDSAEWLSFMVEIGCRPDVGAFFVAFYILLKARRCTAAAVWSQVLAQPILDFADDSATLPLFHGQPFDGDANWASIIALLRRDADKLPGAHRVLADHDRKMAELTAEADANAAIGVV